MLFSHACTKLSMLSTNFWDSPRICIPFRVFVSDILNVFDSYKSPINYASDRCVLGFCCHKCNHKSLY